MSAFGFLAENAKVKVTNEVKRKDTIVIIPCQMGFKQKDGKYAHEWVDVMLYGSDMPKAEGIKKGDKIFVWGRMHLNEYNDKKSWQIWASDILKEEKETDILPDKEQDIPLSNVPF
jgi:single-stranded DNA-binding protein